MVNTQYQRILLKISGEALLGNREHGVEPAAVLNIAKEIYGVQQDLGVQIALVVGGGNIFRGVKVAAKGMDRATADYMGMLATMMNGLALHDAFSKVGADVRLQSAINSPQIAEPYIRQKAIRHMQKGRIVILSAGTGSPYFTTDTTAALRAVELKADIILKGTKVDGIYDKDPNEHDDAVKYEQVSYDEALAKELRVMDMTAFAMCRDNDMPIVVFDFFQEGNLRRIIKGEDLGTLIQ